MESIEEIELQKIRGGSLSATYINAMVKAADLIYEVAQNLGSSLRRWVTGSSCKV